MDESNLVINFSKIYSWPMGYFRAKFDPSLDNCNKSKESDNFFTLVVRIVQCIQKQDPECKHIELNFNNSFTHTDINNAAETLKFYTEPKGIKLEITV